MRAASLFVVLTVAHLLMLAGHSVPFTPWTLPAYLWQDLLATLLFGVVDHFIKNPRIGWAAYAVLVFYVAFNVPIARVLSSPLTLTMIRAARGPLLDSIRFYVTASNIASILVVLTVGLLAPLALMRLKFSVKPVLILAIIIVTAFGPLAS